VDEEVGEGRGKESDLPDVEGRHKREGMDKPKWEKLDEVHEQH